jgi:hypothetical protein
MDACLGLEGIAKSTEEKGTWKRMVVASEEIDSKPRTNAPYTKIDPTTIFLRWPVGAGLVDCSPDPLEFRVVQP